MRISHLLTCRDPLCALTLASAGPSTKNEALRAGEWTSLAPTTHHDLELQEFHCGSVRRMPQALCLHVFDSSHDLLRSDGCIAVADGVARSSIGEAYSSRLTPSPLLPFFLLFSKRVNLKDWFLVLSFCFLVC